LTRSSAPASTLPNWWTTSGSGQERLQTLDLNPAIASIVQVPAQRRAGFLAIRSPIAADLVRGLRQRGVYSDFRRDILRFGPAPYLTDEQLADGMSALGEVVLRLPRL